MKITPNNNEKTFKDNILLVTKTDLQGRIMYSNRAFMEIVGIDEKTLIGSPHSIVRHPDMPKIIFKYLWNYLQDAKEIHAYVKNLCTDGSYYWVMANVTPSFDNSQSEQSNTIVGYHSARRSPNPKSLETVKILYKKLLDAEKTGGIQASEKMMQDILKEKGVSYDEFILSI